MRYPIAIEPRTERSDYGVVVPDLPGAFSAGETLDEAIAGAEEAGLAWIDAALDTGEAIPEPSPLESIRARPEFAGWILSLVTINPAALDDEAIAGAEEAGLAWIDAALDTGEAVPEPSPLESIRARPEFAGWILSLVTINPAALDDTVERVNITLPRRVLRRLDEEARAAGETRSGYIAKLEMGR
jgi:predicted RNase H-like HicB family nuclease